MAKKFTSILNIVFVSLLFIVVGFFIVSLMPIQGNIKIKIVKSGSMEPTIKTGAVVIIKPSNTYKVGDIITFGRDTKSSIPTTHRIVSIKESSNGTYFTTKGDANDEADSEETNKNNVIGHVIFSLPYAGYILDFARQPVGFISLIAVPAGLVVIYEILAIFGEIKNMLSRRGSKKRIGKADLDIRNT